MQDFSRRTRYLRVPLHRKVLRIRTTAPSISLGPKSATVPHRNKRMLRFLFLQWPFFATVFEDRTIVSVRCRVLGGHSALVRAIFSPKIYTARTSLQKSGDHAAAYQQKVGFTFSLNMMASHLYDLISHPNQWQNRPCYSYRPF